jgi:lipoate-protein ligase A
VWRLIPLIQASGKRQMAVDWWLFEQHRRRQHPPTLRFYLWSPPAISLGYHQRHFPESWRELTWRGEKIDLVRRPTGGRAVLHQGDLTYMVVTSGCVGNRLQVYQQICQFLMEGWRSLGIELHYGQAGRGYIHNPHCFSTATGADLVDAGGQKLIGSAQLRQGNAILQHGSMLLAPAPELYQQVFGQLPTTNYKFLSHLNIIEALTLAARNCFGSELVEQPLSEEEWQEILLVDG